MTESTSKVIYVERRIKETDYMRNFIFNNINYRRLIWNFMVEKFFNIKDNGGKFSPLDIDDVASSLISTIDSDYKSNDEKNKYYCTDIIKSVRFHFRESFYAQKEDHEPTFKFKVFNRFKGCFDVLSRNCLSKKGKRNGKVNIQDKHTIFFKASKYGIKNYFNIELVEPIYDKQKDGEYYIYKNGKKQCKFRHEDIKWVYFKHEIGKFYIGLAINVTYFTDKKENKKRKKVCGIDLGIRNPIVTYDGSSIHRIVFSDKENSRLHYLERRTYRLEHILNHKYAINFARHEKDPSYEIYTKQYNKVLRKFNVTHRKIRNIRKNWRRKISKYLATTYTCLIVDGFSCPKPKKSKFSSQERKTINKANRFYGMYDFFTYLKHACKKYSCEFINAPPDTTRTCSICGEINKPLSFNVRDLYCEKCKSKINRDVNAAINCYKSFFIKS